MNTFLRADSLIGFFKFYIILFILRTARWMIHSFVPFHGWGQDESPFIMAVPIRRGQVTKLSRHSFALATKWKSASKGCKITHTAEAKKATGHTRKTRMMIQRMEKQGFPMVVYSCCVSYDRLNLRVERNVSIGRGREGETAMERSEQILETNRSVCW